MAANRSNNWRHVAKDDNDASSIMEMDAERVRQLTASRMQSAGAGGNALNGGGGGMPGALELALLQQQQKSQFPVGGGYSSRISNEELVAAAAAAAVGANAHLSMAFAPSPVDANANGMMYPPNSNRVSPIERGHLNPMNPKTNILQLSMGPTMTSPYAAHMQMAQRAFQVQQVGPNAHASDEQAKAMLTSPLMASLAHRVLTQQNQEQLLQQQQRQFLLQQLGSNNMEENSGMPALSSISNMEILQYLEQKQQQDLQAKLMAAAAASSSSAAAKPPPVPSTAVPSPSAALTTRKESSFPLKLHSILANPEFQEYITWLPNGRSWRILKPAAFERVVIPLVFRHAKYASFMRQVNGWGFKRITGGPASGAAHNSYYHQVRSASRFEPNVLARPDYSFGSHTFCLLFWFSQYFIREYPQLCLQMKRVGKTPNGSKGNAEGGARVGDHDDTSVTSDQEE